MISLLLILLPLLTGLAAFFIKDEKLVRTWALLTSLATLVIAILSLCCMNDTKSLNYHCEWLPSLGASFSLKMDGAAQLLCLLNTIAYPLVFIAGWDKTYKNAKNFFALMLLAQAGMMGVFLAADALLFYFFWELALIPMYFLCSQWGGEKRIAVTFKFFIYNSTYSEGNPYLRPQYTYVYELGHTYNQKISATLAYSLTKENITEVIFPAPDLEKITIQTNRNLAQFEFWGLNISAPFPLAKWWNSVNNINIYYGIYTGSLANTNLNNGKLNFNLSSNNSITINDNGWSAEINGVYRAPENYGFMQVRSNGGLSAGVQKTILNNKGTLRLNVSDIFYTQGARAVTTFRDYEETFEVLRETRVATLAFSYRFGNTKVPGARRRSGGAEEEKQRAGNG